MTGDAGRPDGRAGRTTSCRNVAKKAHGAQVGHGDIGMFRSDIIPVGRMSSIHRVTGFAAGAADTVDPDIETRIVRSGFGVAGLAVEKAVGESGGLSLDGRSVVGREEEAAIHGMGNIGAAEIGRHDGQP